MLKQTNLTDTPEIIVGRSLVKVWRKDVDEQTGREKTRMIHEGVVISNTGSFVRVFNNAPVAKGGDLSPEHAIEQFAIKSPKVWVEVVGCKKPENAFPIPPTLR